MHLFHISSVEKPMIAQRCSEFRRVLSEVPGKSCPGPKQNLSFAKGGACGHRAGPGMGTGTAAARVPRERGTTARGRMRLLALDAAARPGQRLGSSIIHHPSSTTHHPPSTIHHPSSIIHHPPSIIQSFDCACGTAARVLNHDTPISANHRGRGHRPALASPETTHLHGRRIQTAPKFAPGLALHTGCTPSARCSFCSFFNTQRFFSSFFSFFFYCFFPPRENGTESDGFILHESLMI